MAVTTWPEVRLGDIATFKHGWPFKSELFSEYTSPQPIVVAIGNFRYTGGFRFGETMRKGYLGEYPREYELSPGDILLVMTCQTAGGEILGVPATVPDDGRLYLHNQRLAKLVLRRDEVSARFLYWLFLSRDFNRALFATSSGTKIVHTAPSRIEAFRFRLPPRSEQDGIAAILDALDDKTELNRRIAATLEEMARTLFKSWFVDFDISDGLLPDGWRHGSIDDVAELNPESWSSRTRPATIEYVDLSNTKWGRIEATTTLAAVDAPSRAQRVLRSGDSIIGTVRPGNGSFSLVRRDGLTGSTGFAVLRPRHRANSAFVYLAATRPETISTLAHLADGGAYPAVRPEIVAQQPVVVPTTQVLDEFAAVVDPLLARIGRADEESRTLAELRDLLLPKLLSGELRIRDAERAVEAVA